MKKSRHSFNLKTRHVQTNFSVNDGNDSSAHAQAHLIADMPIPNIEHRLEAVDGEESENEDVALPLIRVRCANKRDNEAANAQKVYINCFQIVNVFF